MYAAGAKSPAALLDSLFQQSMFPSATGRMLERLLGIEKIFELFNGPVPQTHQRIIRLFPVPALQRKGACQLYADTLLFTNNNRLNR